MRPRPNRIRSLARSPWVIGIIIAATPALARAQEDTLPTAEGTEVRVSRREVTVTFPEDPAYMWGWPDRDRGGAYSWRLTINDDEGPPRAITLRVEPQPWRPGRTFGLLEGLVSTGDARVCWPVEPYCDGTRVRATARERRLVLTVRDSAAISELFGLRPEMATASLWRPGMRERARSPVRVTYVDPHLPLPDSAFRAAAAEQRRLHFSRVNRATRTIVAERPHANLWLVVGDSVRAGVRESRCSYDTCVASTPAFPGARWSVADSSIARVQPTESGLARVFALRPGRTVLRATGLHGTRDTVPEWNPFPEEAEREVVVTLPVAAVRICPRRAVYADAPFPLHVEVVDSGGNVFRDPPVGIRLGNGSFEIAPSDTAEIRFQGAGSTTLTAAFAGHADTLRLRVIARRPRAEARPASPGGDAEECSSAALSSALPVRQPPED